MKDDLDFIPLKDVDLTKKYVISTNLEELFKDTIFLYLIVDMTIEENPIFVVTQSMILKGTKEEIGVRYRELCSRLSNYYNNAKIVKCQYNLS
jgi:hypothetical protein